MPMHYVHAGGPLPAWHRPYLDHSNWATSYDVTTRLINEMQLGMGVELGTAYGWHADQILLRCPTANVISIDAYDPAVDKMIKQFNHGRYEHCMSEMLSLLKPHGQRFQFVRETTLKARIRVPDRVLDWIYVDAAHDETNAYADLQAWFSSLRRPGGLFMGHDYGHETHTGVKRAVDRFLAEQQLTLSGVENYVWWVKL